MGSVGQSAYSAAKAGIAGLTLVQAAELGRYGVTANALAPSARTRMTEGVFAEMMAKPTDGSFDAMAPENVSPLVAWLVLGRQRRRHRHGCSRSRAARCVADGWQHGTVIDNGARWHPADLGAAVRKLLAEAPDAAPVYGAELIPSERADRQDQEEDDQGHGADVEDEEPEADRDAAAVVAEEPDAESERRREDEQAAQDAEVAGPGDDARAA